MSRKKLRFSVVICGYNLGNLVKYAIESVLNQDFTNFELILVNDCSTDDTLDYMKMFAEKDPRITIINNPKNVGISAARNKGTKKAKGEYIVHLDGDDTLYSNTTLSKINETLGDDNPDICYFGVQYVGGSNMAYIPTAENSTKEARIVCDIHFPVASKVWRRKFVEEQKLSFVEGMYYEDMVYSIRGAIFAEKLKFGSFPIYYYYRNRQGSIMSTPDIKRCKDMYKMLYYLMELYEETPERLKPYLLSFIKNETFGVPARLDGILKSMKDKSYSPVFPKRNYIFLGNVDNDNNKYDDTFTNNTSEMPKVITVQVPDSMEIPDINFVSSPASKIAAGNINVVDNNVAAANNVVAINDIAVGTAAQKIRKTRNTKKRD